MRLLFRISNCTNKFYKLKLTQPKLLWLEHRAVLSSSAHWRRRQPAEVRTSVCPTPAAGSVLSALSRGSQTGVSVLHGHSPARTVLHTPVAFSSSSAAASPAPAGAVKTQEKPTPSTVPLKDVKRILRLSHPERWRLAGRSEAPHSIASLYVKINWFVTDCVLKRLKHKINP